MATYTYTTSINLTGITWPVQISWLYYQNGNDLVNLSVSGQNNITDWASAISSAIDSAIGGNTAVSYQVTANIASFTIVTDVDSNDLAALQVYDDIDGFFISPWIPSDTTPCPHCQPLAITNCGPVEISLPLPDDDYTVTLYDNQSGVSYEQNVQWTAGTGTWNTTNTAGVFTPFNIFTLTVTDSEGEPVSWPVGPNEYTCARVTFSATVDTNVND